MERSGLVELRFRLEVDKSALIYQTQSAGLCFGSLRFSLPGWLSPIVRASEKSLGDKQSIAVSVEIELPLAGTLIAYCGKLTRFEVQK